MSGILVDSAQAKADGGAGGTRLAVVLFTGRDLMRVVRLSTGDSVVVGRQAPSDVEIPDPSLSRRHARFDWDGRTLTVEDLGSTNGTQVAGAPVSQCVLRQGQEAHLGAVTAVAYMRQAPAGRSAGAAAGPIIRSSAMADVYALVDEYADQQGPVFVCGEPGVGKALVAATLHGQSRRSRQPFETLDCARVAPEALDAALFGQWGSHSGSPGQLVGVRGGTLYLANIPAMSGELQRRLARVQRDGRMPGRPGGQPVPVDARLVLGAQRPLATLVAEGGLDPELASVCEERQVELPPLRSRGMEIRPLAKCFAREAAETWSVACPELCEDALEVLEQYSWPGNVRQLQEVLELLVLTVDGAAIDAAGLPAALQVHQTVPLPPRGPAWATALTDAAPILPEQDDGRDFRTRVREFEERLILEGLRRTGGNQRAASRLLRIPLRTLAHKLKEFELKDRV